MVRASARQNFDGDAVASSRNFNTQRCETGGSRI